MVINTAYLEEQFEPTLGDGSRWGLRDLARPLADGDRIEIVTPRSGDDYLYVMRHSAAHVMAEAVQSLFPDDLARPLADGDRIEIVTPRSGDDYLYVMRHSAAQTMTHAAH